MLKRLCLAPVALLAACGGGGGGNQLSLSLSPNPLTGSFFPSDLPAYLQVQASVSGSISADRIYVVVTDPGNTFQTGMVTVGATGPNTYRGTLTVPGSVAAGSHAGILGVSVCGDAQCQNLFASASLPYSITINTPTIALQSNPLGLAAVQGGVTRIQATVRGVPNQTLYARIADPANTFSSDVVAMESTALNGDGTITFQGAFPTQPGISPTRHAGNLDMTICVDSGCQRPYSTLSAAPYAVQVFSVLAGSAGAYGDIDGPGASARFNGVHSAVLDGGGNLYVTDPNNSAIRKIAPDGTVSTVLSNALVYGAITRDSRGNIYFATSNGTEKLAADGTLSRYSARSMDVVGLATDGADNLYEALRSGSYAPSFGGYPGSIDKIAPGGSTSAVANGTNLPNLSGLAADAAGNLFFSEFTADMSFSPFVGKLAADGTVSTLSTTILRPRHVALDPSGNLFVTDDFRKSLFKIGPDGVQSVAIPAGGILSNGAQMEPFSVTFGPNGELYWCDFASVVLKTVLPTGQ